MPTENGWIVPGIVPVNGLVVLASAPKAGKSVLANAICRALCSGGEFAETRWQQKYPVAWCAHEETKEERGPLLAGLTKDDPYYVSFPPELPCLDDPECSYSTDRHGRFKSGSIPYVYSTCRDQGVKLLVIDCLHGALRHTNLAENHAARRIMTKLRQWSSTFGIATIVIHHLTKTAHRGYHPERFADSAQILASASCHFFFESEELEDKKYRIVLHGAGRQPAPPRRQEFIADGFFNYRRIEPATENEKPASMSARIRLLLEEGWELTADEIAKRLNLNPRSVRNVLTDLPGVSRLPGPTKRVKYGLE